MSYLSRPMGIPQFTDPDRRAAALYADPAIQAAIKQREAQIQANIEAEKQARSKARVEALSPSRCAEIERRIFNQVAVGGIRNGRS